MSHAKQTTTVIAGEASESDDDYSTGTPTWSDAGNVGPEPVPQGIQQGTSQITNTPAGTGIVVSGEASESDDENDKNTTAPYPVMTVTDEDHSLISAELPTRPTMNLPAYDSLLHRKLRETNATIRGHLQDVFQKQFESAGRNIRGVNQQLASSQLLIQEISHTMRLLTNDLFQLEDKVDIVVTCPILPQVNVR
jgi:uncharacterized coiled-coil protein SlyX